MKYVFLIPAVILLILFTLWPLAELGLLSIQKTDFIEVSFIGVQNYIDIFKSGAFMGAAFNSILYIAWLNVLTVMLPLAISLWIWRLPKRWLDASRLLLYIPSLASGLVISQLWKNIFHIQGPINQLLKILGFAPVNFFGSRVPAVSTIAIIISLSGGFASIILFLAAISAISRDTIDAAQIDGAGWGRISVSIILPRLVPMYGLLSLVSAIGACQIFETIQWLAPFEYASTMTHRIWLEAFQFSRHGSAAAMAVVFLFIMVGLAIVKEKIAQDVE